MSKRAIRRHHEKRIKDKVSKYSLYQWCSVFGEEVQAKILGKMAASKALCSCPMCGNPRKWFHEVTLAEKSHMEKLKEEMNDIWVTDIKNRCL